MFGGIAFLTSGNLAVAASGQGGLLVRVDPDQSESLCARTGAEPAVMRGRPMAGWLRVHPPPGEAEEWARRGLAYARTLPPK